MRHYGEGLAPRKPGTYNVYWCDGSRQNIPSARKAMEIARRASSKRFANETCGGSTVTRNISTTSAVQVAVCRERACASSRAGLSGAKRRRRR